MAAIEQQSTRVWFRTSDVYSAKRIPVRPGSEFGEITLFLANGSGTGKVTIPADLSSMDVWARVTAQPGVKAGDLWFRDDVLRAVEINIPTGNPFGASAKITIQATPAEPFKTIDISDDAIAIGDLQRALPKANASA